MAESDLVTQANRAFAAAQAQFDKLKADLNSGLSDETKAKQKEVKAFQKKVRKSPFTNFQSGTDIGVLIKDRTRLNGFSTLKKEDKVDFYKFKVATAGDIKFGSIGAAKGLRFQIMNSAGTVIADSDEKAGRLQGEFVKADAGFLNLKAGDYYVKVTRGAKAKAENIDYSVQIKMGTYTQDYETIAQQPKFGDGLPSTPANVQTLQDMMQTAQSTIQSLPAIGTSATAKLTGLIYNGSA